MIAYVKTEVKAKGENSVKDGWGMRFIGVKLMLCHQQQATGLENLN